MKLYLVSLAAGLVVGVIYSLLNVRSPAPPLVALVGLLGILAGEQIIPVSRHVLAGTPLAQAWRAAHVSSHLFPLPGRHAARAVRIRLDGTPRSTP
jgi:XapX domain-containing protein